MKEQIFSTIISSINEFNESIEEKIQVSNGRDTPLFGKDGVLDSLSLVNLIVQIEENIAEEFNKPITLTSEKAMSRKLSPFLTVGTLTDYIEEILSEAK
jgi:D-alanine--poly(phosphoribitol) ligase subunit 2